jgi:uncharacterized protein
MEDRMRDWRLTLRSVLCVGVLLHAWTASGQAIEASFRSDIQKLLETTGSTQLGAQVANYVSGQMIDGLKQSQPSIPDRAVAIVKQVLEEEFAKAFDAPDGLREQLVVIYAKHFTHEDVRGLLMFYSSDLGKKVMATLPMIFQESAAAGQQWAQAQTPRIASVIQTRLRAEGFVK